MTGNSTRYQFVRRALRSLFAADVDLDGDLKGPARKVWFAEDWQEAPCGLGMMLDKVTGGMMKRTTGLLRMMDGVKGLGMTETLLMAGG